MKSISKFFSLSTLVLLALFLGLRDVQPAKADDLLEQTITVVIHAPASAAYGESFTVEATASSGLDVAYSALGDCTNLGATFTMTSDGSTCTVQYDQAGDSAYNPAPQVTEDVAAQLAATPTSEPDSATPTAAPATVTPTRIPNTWGQLVGPGLYVSAQGDDQGGVNSCSNAASPCRTIQQAVTKAASGDTIYVASGTFNGVGASPIVTINKNLVISGGWDGAFDTQTSLTILDGQDARSDVVVNTGVTASIEKFVVTNSKASGIKNLGTLTVQHCMIYNNDKPYPDANGTSASDGGGIHNTGTLVVANTAIYGNYANFRGGGGIFNTGSLTVKNSTIANNNAHDGGGIIYTPTGYAGTAPSVILRNVTLSGNNAEYGKGIYRAADIDPVFLQNPVLHNSIMANNNCHGSLTSTNNNLIYQSSGCTITGLYTNANPLLGAFSAANGYFPLLYGSPAIDAGSPLTPGSGGEACEAVDQLGTTRPLDGDEDTIAVCDIGAYERDLSVPGIANAIDIDDGSPQSAEISTAFPTRLSALVTDQFDAPMEGITVTFLAPSSAASGTFGDSGTNTTTAVTDTNGIATAAVFTANATLGSYPVSASVSGISNPVQFYLANSIGPILYVSPLGNDTNNCGFPTDACLTINAALNKAKAGDTIKVAVGTYIYAASTANFVVTFNIGITLSGGWDTAFTEQSGMSIIDGQGIHSGILVNLTATLERFAVQNGVLGISNPGNLTLNNSIVRNNNGVNGGGIHNYYGTLTLNDSDVASNLFGISNYQATLTLNNSSVIGNSHGGIDDRYSATTLNNTTVSGNTSSGGGGGIDTGHSVLTLNNSTISGNTAGQGGGGISSYSSIITITNSTISGNNSSYQGGGGIDNNGGSGQGSITLKNSIVALNTGYPNPDCSGYIISGGYNLIGNTTACSSYTAGVGDLLNVDPKLIRLMGSAGYFPLLPDSPAINAGNPTTCPATDQRGVVRPQGGRCDIGAYEYTAPGPAASIGYAGGSNQSGEAGSIYGLPFEAYAVDSVGSPVAGVLITFSAPSSGPSGSFSNTGTHTTTAVTNSAGFAVTPTFTANGTPGSYDVSATAIGLPNVVTFALTNLPIPVPLSPAGSSLTIKPTYLWTKVTGATEYKYELWDGSTLAYSKTVASNICGSTTCSDTPAYTLKRFSYSWRVSAMVGGVWEDFSNYKLFSVAIQSGLWNKPGVGFNVTPNRTFVKNFSIYVYVYGCGNYKITHKPTPINNNRFMFKGKFYASGTFSNPTHVSGKLGLTRFLLPGCGFVSGGPFLWKATWKNKTQPKAFITAEVVPLLTEPGLQSATSDYFTVERVGP